MRPAHLCFVALNIYPVMVQGSGVDFVGGAEVQQSVQIRALQRAGHRLSVLVGDHGQPDVVDCEGIALHKVPAPARRGLRWTSSRPHWPRCWPGRRCATASPAWAWRWAT